MKVKLKSLVLAALLVALVRIESTRCDLYIFSKDKDSLELNKQKQIDNLDYRPYFVGELEFFHFF